METDDVEGVRRLKFGVKIAETGGKTGGNPGEPAENAAAVDKEGRRRCEILRRFGIMWLAPFCHLNPRTGLIKLI